MSIRDTFPYSGARTGRHVYVRPTMQAGDPWAHVRVTKARAVQAGPGHDPYNHIGRLIPRRYSK